VIKIAARIYHKTKNTTMTIGSIEEQSRIVSDIVIGGAEKAEVNIDAVDGTNYAFAGNPSNATVTFDFLVSSSYNIEEMVYGPETTASSPVEHTLVWNGAGSEKTITIANAESEGQIFTVTLINVDGISAPITYTKGEAVVRTFNGIVDAQDVTEVLIERA